MNNEMAPEPMDSGEPVVEEPPVEQMDAPTEPEPEPENLKKQRFRITRDKDGSAVVDVE
jgi:hypothetical protein